MKKIFILILLIVFITGCDIDYNLTIGNNVYEEILKIIPETIDEKNAVENDEQPINSLKSEVFPSESLEKIPGIEYYDIKDYSNPNFYRQISYSFNDYNINDSNIIKSCFPYIKIENDTNKKIRTINTNGALNCNQYFDFINNITININPNYYKIVKSNADEITQNKLVWNYNKSNFEKKTIYLEYYYDKINEEEQNKADVFLYIFGGIIGFITILFVVIKIKGKTR